MSVSFPTNYNEITFLRLSVNASFIPKSIKSVTDVQGLMNNVCYFILRFWGYKNNIPCLTALSSNPKGKPVLIFFYLDIVMKFPRTAAPPLY